MQRIATAGKVRRGQELVKFATQRLSLAAVSRRVDKSTGEDAIMKMTRIAMLVMTIAVVLFILIPNLSWAEDGAGLYKAKCAACHGADGAGKAAAKIPSLVSDDVKKISDDDIGKVVTTNAKHAAIAKALSADQVKAIVAAIRDLQKK
jgi:cytochrome c553